MSSPSRRPAPGVDVSLGAGALGALAGLSGVAAGIHLSVAPEHFDEWWGYGTFFLAAAAGECALVVALALRPRSWVVQTAIWTTVATMLMYLVSRTSGIPLGPEKGVVETVDLPGLAATAAEGALVVLLCLLLAGRERRLTLNALALAGVALWLAAFTGALVPPARPIASPHAGHAAEPSHAGMGVPFIPDSVRNAPRVPGDG